MKLRVEVKFKFCGGKGVVGERKRVNEKKGSEGTMWKRGRSQEAEVKVDREEGNGWRTALRMES